VWSLWAAVKILCLGWVELAREEGSDVRCCKGYVPLTKRSHSLCTFKDDHEPSAESRTTVAAYASRRSGESTGRGRDGLYSWLPSRPMCSANMCPPRLAATRGTIGESMVPLNLLDILSPLAIGACAELFARPVVRLSARPIFALDPFRSDSEIHRVRSNLSAPPNNGPFAPSKGVTLWQRVAIYGFGVCKHNALEAREQAVLKARGDWCDLVQI
jgi:hypothetical protein